MIIKKEELKEKSQVSVFVVFAIIIVVAVGIGYYLSKNNFTSVDDTAKINSILGSIDTCKSLSADNSVKKIGIQGGYDKHPETYLDFGWMFIPYYFIEGKTYFPDKTKIEENLADIFNQNFQQCLKVIDTLGFELKTSQSKTIVKIINDTIKFDIGMKITLGRDFKTTSYDLKKAPLIRNYRLNDMYEVAKYITDSHNTNPPMLCADCLVDLADKKGLLVNYFTIDKNTKVAIISENNDNIGNYVYQFAEKYSDDGGSIAGIPEMPKNGI